MLRILLVDDHGVVRSGLKALIEAQGGMQVVGEAADGFVAITEAERLKPDVIVMDVALPKLGGIEATREIHAVTPNVKILVLTAHEERAYVKLLLEAGAAGYMLKRTAGTDLPRAIEAVAGGGVYLDPSITAQVVPRSRRRTQSGEFVAHCELSERELEVLRFVAHGLGAREIAEKLDVSVRTVETYKMRAMGKLALKSRADVVTYAVRRGWLDCA